MRSLASLLASLACSLLAALPAHSQGSGCEPTWPRAFGAPGCAGGINDALLFDDGSGPAVYVTGFFKFAGDVQVGGIARWTGTEWEAVGSGVGFEGSSTPRGNELCVYDDGTGPELVVSGRFDSVDGVAASNVARWDGQSWSGLGAGPGGEPTGITAFDSGNGPELWVAMIGIPGRLRSFDGSTWTDRASLQPGQGAKLTVYDDGSGTALFAGGSFTQVAGVPASGLARFDGQSWTEVGGGIFSNVGLPSVEEFFVQDFGDGAGEVLVLCGSFNLPSPLGFGLARWDGTSLTDYPSNPGLPESLGVQTQGGSKSLLAAFYSQGEATVSRFDGVDWVDLGGADLVNGSVYALVEADLGAGLELFMFGLFNSTGPDMAPGPVTLDSVGRWDGTEWVPVGSGLNGTVEEMMVFDDGSGEALIVAGNFTHADGQRVDSIAKFTANGWEPMGAGLINLQGLSPTSVNALAVWDDGTHGPQLYAGGRFTHTGNDSAKGVVRWDGSQWNRLGNGVLGDVLAIQGFGVGFTTKLFVSGDLVTAGGAIATSVVFWDGASWSNTNGFVSSSDPSVLKVFNFGGGPRLLAGASSFNRWLCYWSGSKWVNVQPALLTGPVRALEVFDDGSGPALYVGGDFDLNGVPGSKNIARWDGTAWSTLGAGTGTSFQDSVIELKVVPDPASPGGQALFVSGPEQVFGPAPIDVGGLAKWNAGGWSPVASAVPQDPKAMTSFDDGTGDGEVPILGGFSVFSPSPAPDRPLTKLVLPCDPPFVFCPKLPDSGGCLAAIQTSDPSGQPTSGANDYSVVATDVLDGTNGLLVFSASGAGMVPVLGGTLCLQPPVKRIGLQSSGGSPSSCAGAFTWTVNDGQLPPAGVDPGAGQSGWYQWWYRDNQGVLGAALSDAVQLDFE